MQKDLSNLKPAKGSVKTKRRRGRGAAAGRGGHTAGRGHNGARSRSGHKRRDWFEGGQMPINRRLPKRGFTNIWREDVQIINIADLERLVDGGTDVNRETCVASGLVKTTRLPVKLLGDGEVTIAYNVDLDAVSASAKEKIEKAGGTVKVPEAAPKRGKYVKKSERVASA